MKKQKIRQFEINKAVGRWTAAYLRGKEEALVMIHLLNYRGLAESEKRFVFIVFNSDGTARINHVFDYYVYVAAKSNFHKNRSRNILTAYSHYGRIKRVVGDGIGLNKFTSSPFDYLEKYKIIQIIQNIESRLIYLFLKVFRKT